ncbi:MAG: VWA domain-containing protein [Kiritimatiellae bacterium]|nr:VWA domain-containing protein [Kiritimatiellia bacterium]MBQ6140666.1 VWA domain-containing protein [Kiritimatiellia bacterium]MBQ6330565.1 VWA domain-containing protein [Kiritimatiellia bacterium]
MMTLAHPYTLLLLLPLAFAAWRLLRRTSGANLKFSAVARLPVRQSGWRRLLAAAAPWMMLAALAVLVVAAARPRTPLARQKKSVDAIAIVMAVDVSGSMLALDLAPRGTDFTRPASEVSKWTRLNVVKKMFADFVDKRPDDLIGLVAFGSYASVRVPLTADHTSLLNALKAVEIPDGDGEAETAIGDGLSVALLRIKDAKPKSKIVVLLSDGENNNGAVDPDKAADMAEKMGVKVYTIGVGTGARMTPRLLRDRYGREFVRMYPSGFNEDQLRSIAKKTKGMYFPVNDRDALEKALSDIDKLETTPLDADVWNRWKEYFEPLLACGSVLALLSVVFSMAAFRRMA